VGLTGGEGEGKSSFVRWATAAASKLAVNRLLWHNAIMLRVDCQKWDQSVDDLGRFAIEAPHRRTRERFAALYAVAQGTHATQVARQLLREDETVHRWVHSYNRQGPQALIFKRPGGRPPFARRSPPP